ncbi:hypothetical protein L1887_39720 [Cichorium endivia]|nr:hypothetical protein L1887_39720 [Cichorium endivia]
MEIGNGVSHVTNRGHGPRKVRKVRSSWTAVLCVQSSNHILPSQRSPSTVQKILMGEKLGRPTMADSLASTIKFINRSFHW